MAELVESQGDGQESAISAGGFQSMDDVVFVNTVANSFPFSAIEKQGLLEEDSIVDRYEKLLAMIDFFRRERQAPTRGPQVLN